MTYNNEIIERKWNPPLWLMALLLSYCIYLSGSYVVGVPVLLILLCSGLVKNKFKNKGFLNSKNMSFLLWLLMFVYFYSTNTFNDTYSYFKILSENFSFIYFPYLLKNLFYKDDVKKDDDPKLIIKQIKNRKILPYLSYDRVKLLAFTWGQRYLSYFKEGDWFKGYFFTLIAHIFFIYSLKAVFSGFSYYKSSSSIIGVFVIVLFFFNVYRYKFINHSINKEENIKRNKENILEYFKFFILFVLILSSCGLGLFSMKNSLKDFNFNQFRNFDNGGFNFNKNITDTNIGKNGGNYEDSNKIVARIKWDEKPGSYLPAAYFSIPSVNGEIWTNIDIVVQLRNGLKEINKNENGSFDIKYNYNYSYKYPNNNEYIMMQNTLKKDIDRFDFLSSMKLVSNTKEIKNIISKTSNIQTNKSAQLEGYLNNGKEVVLPIVSNADNITFSKESVDIEQIRLNNKPNSLSFFNKDKIPKTDALINYKEDSSGYIYLDKASEEDLVYPVEKTEVLEKIVKEANLSADLDVNENIKRLHQWYADNFSYTLNYTDNGKIRTLDDFLISSRRGHCEYFASSTALILRYVGIPTKYVTGFLVNDRREDEGSGMYWIRLKNAHAWNVYWDGSGWKIIDNTPASIIEGEEDEETLLSVISDKIEHWSYVYDNWVMTDKQIQLVFLVIILLIALTVSYFKVKNLKARRVRINKNFSNQLDRDFYTQMFKYIKKYPKHDSETWMEWAKKTKDNSLIDKVKKYYHKRYINKKD